MNMRYVFLLLAIVFWCFSSALFLSITEKKTLLPRLDLRKNLLISALLYVLSALLSFQYFGLYGAFLGSMYAAYMLLSWYIASPTLKHKKGHAPHQRILNLQQNFRTLTLLAFASFILTLFNRF